ncbi:hypothetical protein GDO78_014423 [Eleutherodactylus coqui]|uniref:Uncharacterized protein n=1 Tax=Eleutherodactylus coqui TaxID=57060 RepID=A0A8J6B348_ELECQ|nr:hypothetical protein GDO78_014423 [Eleutherodactylus coqui]
MTCIEQYQSHQRIHLPEVLFQTPPAVLTRTGPWTPALASMLRTLRKCQRWESRAPGRNMEPGMRSLLSDNSRYVEAFRLFLTNSTEHQCMLQFIETRLPDIVSR